MNDVIQSQTRKGNTSAHAFDRTCARHACFFSMLAKSGTYNRTKSFHSTIYSDITLPYPLCNAPVRCSVKRLKPEGTCKRLDIRVTHWKSNVQKSRRVDEAPSINDGDLYPGNINDGAEVSGGVKPSGGTRSQRTKDDGDRLRLT